MTFGNFGMLYAMYKPKSKIIIDTVVMLGFDEDREAKLLYVTNSE